MSDKRASQQISGSKLPRFVWRLTRFLPPRLAYDLGLGSLAGRAVLLLTTTGRKSGLPRQTPLLYDEVDGQYFVGSARGVIADWYQNVLADPQVKVRIGSRWFQALAEPLTEPAEIMRLLELRRKNHPWLVGVIFRVAGLGSTPTPEQLEEYARGRAIVVIRRLEDA